MLAVGIAEIRAIDHKAAVVASGRGIGLERVLRPLLTSPILTQPIRCRCWRSSGMSLPTLPIGVPVGIEQIQGVPALGPSRSRGNQCLDVREVTRPDDDGGRRRELSTVPTAGSDHVNPTVFSACDAVDLRSPYSLTLPPDVPSDTVNVAG